MLYPVLLANMAKTARDQAQRDRATAAQNKRAPQPVVPSPPQQEAPRSDWPTIPQ